MAALMRITKAASTEPVTPPATALLSPATTAKQKTGYQPTNKHHTVKVHT